MDTLDIGTTNKFKLELLVREEGAVREKLEVAFLKGMDYMLDLIKENNHE